MAEENVEAAAPEKASGRSGKLFPVLIVALLMGVEGVGVYMLSKALNSTPSEVEGGEVDGTDAGVAAEDLAEIEIASCRPSNKMTGKLITFQIRVSILVPASELDRAKELVKSKQARIEDRVNFVIRSAEPKQLNEPELETIERRIRQELEQVFGEPGLIQEVIIPELLQSGPGV